MSRTKRIRTITSKEVLAKKLIDSLKLNVVAFNKYLHPVVDSMSIPILLNNAHPFDREWFQARLKFYGLTND